MTKNTKAAGKAPAGPPMQPGQMMWEAGIYYMADGFTYESTKPIVNWIIDDGTIFFFLKRTQAFNVTMFPSGLI